MGGIPASATARRSATSPRRRRAAATFSGSKRGICSICVPRPPDRPARSGRARAGTVALAAPAFLAGRDELAAERMARLRARQRRVAASNRMAICTDASRAWSRSPSGTTATPASGTFRPSPAHRCHAFVDLDSPEMRRLLTPVESAAEPRRTHNQLLPMSKTRAGNP